MGRYDTLYIRSPQGLALTAKPTLGPQQPSNIWPACIVSAALGSYFSSQPSPFPDLELLDFLATSILWCVQQRPLPPSSICLL